MAVVHLASVCVFCGSSTPPDPRYRAAAAELGRVVASRGIDLVYGGGGVGLMGEIADAALAAGGRVIGVIPAGLFAVEHGHTGLTALHEVASMHERKQLMYDLSDGFVALPGGLGTLDELAEVSTWAQLGLHAKPVILLDVDGFWDPLVAQLDRMVAVGLLKPSSRELIQRVANAKDAIAMLASAEPTREPKRITPGER